MVDILNLVEALDFAAARRCVIDTVREHRPQLVTETVPLADAAGRVLGRAAAADRDYPPADRSTRDGFAVRASDLPGRLRVIGETRAGETFGGVVKSGECVRIMTGATVPAGADAVVMVEHVKFADGAMMFERAAKAGEFINAAASEAAAGQTVVSNGEVLRFPHIAMLATIGMAHVPVFRKVEVAILATGDEIVSVDRTPLPHQVRNSNSWALAAQVAAAGGVPKVLPVAPDNLEATVRLIAEGLQSDLLLLSGGVSAGEYDFVEAALAQLGAEFYFTRVKMRPGAPAVFGRAQGKFFFGLPGNPLSTAVTFEVFARAALELLSGISEPRWPVVEARITRTLREKGGLTRFLPARLENSNVTPIPWKGSSDVPSLARSNAFLLVDAARDLYQEGDPVPVLPQ